MRYTVSASMAVLTADGDIDLLEILPASNYPIRLVGFTLSQTTEIAEAQEESLRVQVIRMAATVTSGSGGAAPNIEAVNDRAPAAAFAAEVANDTVATTSGATDVLEELGWNVRATPLEKWYDEENQYTFRNGQALLIRLPAAIADDATVQLTATAAASQATIDQANVILSDPSIPATLKNVEGTTKNIEGITLNVQKATKPANLIFRAIGWVWDKVWQGKAAF